MTALEDSARMRLIVLVLSAVAVATMIVIVVLKPTSQLANSTQGGALDSYKALNSELSTCIDHALQVTETSKPDFSSLEQFWRLCENQMYDQLLLNDFTIRRAKFLQNSLDERVHLWLVVVITLSGVGLSAVQLSMSYRLASVAKSELGGSSELIVEQGKLSMKSAYVGMLMMALSLVFFGIYVKWIYLPLDVETSRPANLEAPSSTGNPIDVPGTLGWPEDEEPRPGGSGPKSAPTSEDGNAPSGPK